MGGAAPLSGEALAALRAAFPILGCSSRGRPLAYLDSGATTQKPQSVIDAVTRFYAAGNANIHRGVYQFSEEATLAYDGTRDVVARFLGGVSPDEIVFVRGTTEAMNLVAHAFLKPRLRPGDHVLVTAMEHHANIVPWQLVGAETRAVPFDEHGVLDRATAERMLADGPTLLAITHVSNVLGTVNPVAELCALAREHGVPVVVDGAQAVAHLPVDLTALGADFYAFSGHKLYGPTGVGVLWGRGALLHAMPPFQGGGDMIDRVTFAGTTYAPVPQRFEAGTPAIASVLGLRAALDWFMAQDRPAVFAHEDQVLAHGTALLREIPGLTLVGTAPGKVAALAFTLAGVHPHDLASLLDTDGICVRAGHHCTQPLHQILGVAATTRASIGCYTTQEEMDRLAASLRRASALFQ